MSLSPNDIRNYEFPNQMRGYDKEEVDSFLDQVATTLENLKQDILKMSMENDSIKSQLDSLKQFEDSIKGAAIDARKNADSTMAQAKEEAEKILSESKAKAEELVASKEAMISEYKLQLNRLEQTKNSFATEIKDMINVHMSMIKKISEAEFSYEPEVSNDSNSESSVASDDSGSIDITDSSEVERDKMNTVGSESSNEPSVTEDAKVAEEPSLDPELAAALEGFDHPEPTEDEVTPDTMIGGEGSIPKQGAVVETNMRAEDIPEGFIVGDSIDGLDSSNENEVDTGKVGVSKDSKASPENIVDELDSVVAKFEEEMDKAESK